MGDKKQQIKMLLREQEAQKKVIHFLESIQKNRKKQQEKSEKNTEIKDIEQKIEKMMKEK